MIRHLHTLTSRHLALLLVLSVFGVPRWSLAQEQSGGQSDELNHRREQLQSIASGSQQHNKEGSGYTKHQLSYYLDPNQVSFVRPGLKFTIQNVTIGTDLKIRATFSITDDVGLPLDRNGVVTPGVVSTSFVAAYIPKGQSQYVAYTTRVQTSPITNKSATRLLPTRVALTSK